VYCASVLQVCESQRDAKIIARNIGRARILRTHVSRI
jgi:hypothetical protein